MKYRWLKNWRHWQKRNSALLNKLSQVGRPTCLRGIQNQAKIKYMYFTIVNFPTVRTIYTMSVKISIQYYKQLHQLGSCRMWWPWLHYLCPDITWSVTQLMTECSESITQDRRRSSTFKQKMRIQGKGLDLILLPQTPCNCNCNGNLTFL